MKLLCKLVLKIKFKDDMKPLVLLDCYKPTNKDVISFVKFNNIKVNVMQ